MSILRSWNFEQLKKIMRNHGEIRFKQTAEAANDGSFIRLSGSSKAEFYLKIDDNMRFRIYLPADKQIYIDNDLYQTPKDEYGYIAPAYPCFIADKDRQFVLGLDTEKMEIWEIFTMETQHYPGAEVKVENLTRLFKNSDRWNGIDNLNLTIHPCEFVGIYGGSGSGKSVLMEAILEPDFHQVMRLKKYLRLKLRNWLPTFKVQKKGSVTIDGAEACRATEKIAYLPQHIAFPDNLKCREILQTAMVDRGLAVDWHTIEEKLELCSLDKTKLSTRFGKLSGGEKRRLALAAALLRNNTELLIADEPTTGLDIKSELNVMTSLKKISRHGVTVIVVTHSIQSCRMFDKVIVLNKRKNGSKVVHQKQWVKENFPLPLQNKYFSDEKERDRMDDISDAELMAFLMNDQNYNNPEDKAHKEDEDNQDTNKDQSIPNQARKSKLQRFVSSLYWTISVHKLIRRDIKSVIWFTVLAICCLVAIGLGANGIGTKVDGKTTFITLITITAAWLCATYSAVFVSDLLKYYAWENFSGLKPVSFITGIFTGHFLIVALISAIFTLGFFFFPNTGNMMKWSLCMALPKSDDNKSLCEKCEEKFPQDKLCEKHHKEFINQKISEPLLKKITDESIWDSLSDFYKERHNKKFFESAIDNLWKEIPDNSRYIPKIMFKKEPSYNNVLQWHYAAVYGIMFLICAAGCALGIFAAGLCRKAKNATLFLVVVFVVFLLFSRLFLIANGVEQYLSPLHLLYNYMQLDLEYSQWGCFIPLCLSLFSMSRYITNLICLIPYTDCNSFYLVEIAFFIIVFCILPLMLAGIFVANKKKNWKELSR